VLFKEKKRNIDMQIQIQDLPLTVTLSQICNAAKPESASV